MQKRKEYLVPAAVAVVLHVGSILCLSDFGQNGQAGGDAGLTDPINNYGGF